MHLTIRPRPRFGHPDHAGVESTVETTRQILRELFGSPAERDFAVRYWDGSLEEGNPDRPTRFTFVLRRAGALRRMLLPPSEVAVGEAYLRDDFDIEGDLEAATGLAERIFRRLHSPALAARLMSQLMSLPAHDLPPEVTEPHGWTGRLLVRRHSQKRDSEAVRYHYDTGNEFYSLWLDERMVYSCAYFETGNEDINTAQAAKLEHICRKLRLKPGERLLDIGCGWGGLIIYAAQHYGVDAVGITLSPQQAELARKRIEAAGLSEHCRVELWDYREVSSDEQFDKMVSVGMVEHVGAAMLNTYFEHAYRLLRPGGLFLNHGIVVSLPSETKDPMDWAVRRIWQDGSFTQRYVFPDGELETISTVLRAAQHAGFEVRDAENLREHYAITLRHWVRRLEAHHDEIVRLVGETTYRVWRLYLSGSAHGFASGQIGIVQSLLSKMDEDGYTNLPLTRADLYREPAHAG